MKIRIKKKNSDGIVRLESEGEIKEVMVSEDLMHPEDESISIGFRGKNSSGLIDFTPKEINKILESVKKKEHLIKGFKVMKFER